MQSRSSSSTTGFAVVPNSGTLLPRKESRFEKKVKKVLDREIEPKYFDTSFTYFNVGAGGTTTSLSEIAQGTTQTTRVGTDIRIKQIQFRLSAYQNNTTSVQLPNVVRVILFFWHDNNSVFPPLPTSVLQTASIGSIGQSITSPYVWENERQGTLEVIHDSYHYPSLNGSSIAMTYCKAVDRPVSFTQGGNFGIHKLYVCVLSDDAGVVSPCPSVSFYSRLTFID